MKVPGSGLRIDSPAWPLIQAHISYWGITTAAGDAFGLTLVDALCSTVGQQPSYAGLAVKILDGAAAGQVRNIQIHNLVTGTITVAGAWTDQNGVVWQVPASTRFVILSIGGGGAPPPAPPAPSIGLWMFGMCSPAMAASLNTLVMPNLAGFNDNIFRDEFWIQVIENANNPGVAPEREIRRVTAYVGATGTFTVDPFTANVEANDLVAVFHESIMAIEILGFGTLTASSATVPADNTRAEAVGHFNGCLLLPTEGACAFQPRRIIDFAAGGVFTIDPNYLFTAATGLVDYVLIGDQCGYAWPYIQALPSCMDSPQVNQANIEVARLSIHNLRVDGAVIPINEYQGTVINIDRYRHGVDAGWINIVAAAAMIENPGFATYNNTFPAANWQNSDLIRYRISGTIVRMPAGTPAGVQDFYVPEQVCYGCVGGMAAIKAEIEDIWVLLTGLLTLKETGGTINTAVIDTEYDVYRNDDPMGVYKPIKVMIDFSNQDQGDTVVIRLRYRIVNGGDLILKDEQTFEEAQTLPLKNIELEPNRFGIQVTIERIGGIAQDYNWAAFYDNV